MAHVRETSGIFRIFRSPVHDDRVPRDAPFGNYSHLVW